MLTSDAFGGVGANLSLQPNVCASTKVSQFDEATGEGIFHGQAQSPLTMPATERMGSSLFSMSNPWSGYTTTSSPPEEPDILSYWNTAGSLQREAVGLWNPLSSNQLIPGRLQALEEQSRRLELLSQSSPSGTRQSRYSAVPTIGHAPSSQQSSAIYTNLSDPSTREDHHFYTGHLSS